MKNIISVIILLLFFLVSCSSSKNVVKAEEKNKDSTRIEVRYEKIIEKDTCYIDIPQQSEKIVTAEKYSFLENEYAQSTASIDTLGMLHHWLETKAQKKPVEVENTRERTDSIIYKDRYIYKSDPVEVPRELTWIEQSQIYGFRLLLSAIVIAGIIWKRKEIITLIRRLLS